MAIVSAAVLKGYFEAGDKPTQAQFGDLVDSTYSGEIGAQIVSAASAGSTGLLQIDSASAVSFLVPGSAGRAVVTAGTPASIRTILSAASAGDAIFQIGTRASVRTFISAASDASASTTQAGIIELATTAEATAGTDTTRAITPATLAVAAPSAGRVLIETQTASNSAQLDFTTGIDSTYDKYVFELNDIVPATDGDALNILVRDTTFQNDANDYTYALNGLDSAGTARTETSNGATVLRIAGMTGANLGSAAGEGLAMTLFMSRPADSTLDKLFYGHGCFIQADGSNVTYSQAGRYTTSAAIDGVRFAMGVGNIESGTISLYGLGK